MSEWYTGITGMNITLELCGLALCAVGTLHLTIGPKINRRTRWFFLAYYVMLSALAVCNMLGQLMRGMPGLPWRALLYAVNFGEFSLGGALVLFVSFYMLYAIRPVRHEAAIRRGFWAAGAVQAALLILSQFTGLLYTIGPENVYRRSALYPLSLLIPLGLLVTDGFLLIREGKKLGRRKLTAFTLCYGMPTAALIAQAFVYGVYLVVFACMTAGLTMYLFTATDEKERRLRAEQDYTSHTVSLMLEQMSPHFLFNTLAAIQERAGDDAETGDRLTTQLMACLRYNVESLAKERPVPFDDELAHVRNYLDLMRSRCGDGFRVEYDLEDTGFSLPPLAFQPLVREALRQRGQREAGGTVTIRSCAYPDRFELTVQDDWPWGQRCLLPFERDSESITAWVRERVRKISGGEVRIQTMNGKGYAASIILPRDRTAGADFI